MGLEIQIDFVQNAPAAAVFIGSAFNGRDIYDRTHTHTQRTITLDRGAGANNNNNNNHRSRRRRRNNND